jgi:serine phosphatase RsbU (regulator of sigma subunit)
LERTNQLLCPDLPPGCFVACLYCRLDPTNGELVIGNADQVRPLQAAGANVESVGGKDAPLAVQLNSRYGEFTSLLAEGDSLFLCSSEVLDACNAEGEPFGLARLKLALRAPGAPGAQRIAGVTEALRDFTGGKWANDRDGILIVLDRLPGDAALAQL